MVKNKFTFLLFCCFILPIFAQANNKYIIYFKDKPVEKNVEQYFSKEALEFRKKFNIPFDERDYPVNSYYIELLKNENAIVLNQSNWLNASLISADENIIQNIKHFPFISEIVNVDKKNNGGIASVMDIDECNTTTDVQDFEDNYGSSFPQVHLLNGEYLHEQGFNGENMIIAVCDNGFPNVNNNSGFSHIFNENRLLGTYDYVHNDSLVYDNDGGHGSNCFSFIGGLKANQYIGTASKSNFYLFHTEDNNNEWLQEEFNLATALERSNQVGVNVISISLGYLQFDTMSFQNHDTSDLRKNITPAAKAVNMASSKGMLVCAAAGNKDFTQYINTPADADSVFCVASVNINGISASNSSIGLPNDPRIKPNVAAVGVSPYLINTNGTVGQFGSGTSYATPQIAGLSACLWQAFPDKTAWQIKTAIEQSASQFLTPDKRVGYGIPDFKKAYQLLSSPNYVSNSKLESEIILFPNPINDYLVIQNKSITPIQSVEVFNQVGQLVLKETDFPSSEKTVQMNNNSSGMFLLRILMKNGDVFTKKIIKE